MSPWPSIKYTKIGNILHYLLNDLRIILPPESTTFNHNTEFPLTGACKIVPFGISSSRNTNFVAPFWWFQGRSSFLKWLAQSKPNEALQQGRTICTVQLSRCFERTRICALRVVARRGLSLLARDSRVTRKLRATLHDHLVNAQNHLSKHARRE